MRRLETKRVALDFDHPINTDYPGLINEAEKFSVPCPFCISSAAVVAYKNHLTRCWMGPPHMYNHHNRCGEHTPYYDPVEHNKRPYTKAHPLFTKYRDIIFQWDEIHPDHDLAAYAARSGKSAEDVALEFMNTTRYFHLSDSDLRIINRTEPGHMVIKQIAMRITGKKSSGGYHSFTRDEIQSNLLLLSNNVLGKFFGKYNRAKLISWVTQNCPSELGLVEQTYSHPLLLSAQNVILADQEARRAATEPGEIYHRCLHCKDRHRLYYTEEHAVAAMEWKPTYPPEGPGYQLWDGHRPVSPVMETEALLELWLLIHPRKSRSAQRSSS